MDPLKQELLDKCNTQPHLDGTYFSPDLDKCTLDGSIVAYCQLCRNQKNEEKRICGLINVSSNFTSHIKNSHKRKFEEYQEYTQIKRRTIKQERVKDKLKTYCDFSQAQFDKNICNFVLETLCPFNIVESPAFRRIFEDMAIKKGGKPLKIMSSRTLARKLELKFEDDIKSITESLTKVQFICTTADVWTSNARRFIGMTAHWIDGITMERKSCAIACRRFEGTHTYDRVAKMITDIHSSFTINDKVVSTVTDNASNFAKAFKEFGIGHANIVFNDTPDNASEEESVEEMEVDGIANEDDARIDNFNDFDPENEHAKICSLTEDENNALPPNSLPHHLRCASHTLSLVATVDLLKIMKSLDSVYDNYNIVICRCQALWSLSRSPKKSEAIQKLFNQALKRPIVTRWNSLYDSLKQIFTLKEKILKNTTDIKEIGVNNVLNETDFRFIEEYLHCCKPLADAIDRLQGEKSCFYGDLLPTLISIKNKLKNVQKLTLHYCDELVPGLIDALTVRFKRFFEVEHEGSMSVVAAAFHPQHKLRWIKCLSVDARKKTIQAIKDALSTIELETDLQFPAQTDNTDDYFDFSVDGKQNEESNTLFFCKSEIEIIFEKYLNETRTDLNLLNIYPCIKNIFIKFNCPLPSSAAVERLFSYATMFNLPKYNRLSDKNFELRVLAKCNTSMTL